MFISVHIFYLKFFSGLKAKGLVQKGLDVIEKPIPTAST